MRQFYVLELTFYLKTSKNKLPKPFGVSDTSTNHLQDETIGPNTFEEYKNMIEKKKEDRFLILLESLLQSVIQDFESYLRNERFLKTILDLF